MRSILAQGARTILASFASANVLLAFDFDGTLAPIVASPEKARMRARTRRLLARIARYYPCVIISGRAAADLVKRVEGVPVWHLAGNFGLEPWDSRRGYENRVSEWLSQLKQDLPWAPGLMVEDKKYSITIHYRRVRNKRRIRAAIAGALRSLPRARLIGGTEAVSVIPIEGMHKGAALRRAWRLFGCSRAIYVGDDDTDEDAFASAGAEDLLSIRIGATRRSRARYYVRSQADIDLLLARLLAFRRL